MQTYKPDSGTFYKVNYNELVTRLLNHFDDYFKQELREQINKNYDVMGKNKQVNLSRYLAKISVKKSVKSNEGSNQKSRDKLVCYMAFDCPLTSFVRLVRESICLRLAPTDLATSSIGLHGTSAKCFVVQISLR